MAERFFLDLDRACSETPRVRLRVIGSAALMLQTDYARGTNDGALNARLEKLEMKS